MSSTKLVRGAVIAGAGPSSRSLSSGLSGAAGLVLLLGRVAFAAEPRYETVVVAPSETPREDRSAAASVITTDRTPRSAEDLPQLLTELPGVTVTRYGSYGSLATLSLRGSSPNQVAIYADGVPLGSAVVGTVDLGLVPLTPVGRIEVYRGSSPLAFGSSAMGGVVSLTSEPPAHTGAAAHAGLGSFTTRMGGGEVGWVGRRVSVLARAALFASKADFPYHSDDRTLLVAGDDGERRRENNALDQRDVALRATLDLGGRRTLALAGAFLDRDQGLPTRGTDRSFATALHRRRGYASLAYDGREDLGPGGRVRAVVYGLGAQQRFVDPRGEINFGPIATRDRSFTAGATALGTRPIGTRFSLAGLVDARREQFFPHVVGRPDARPPGDRTFGAAGATATYVVPGAELELAATARAEAAIDSISPLDGPGGQPQPAQTARELLPVGRLGLVWQVMPGIALRGNAGSYARLPSLYERYGNGGSVIGNPLLIPERGETADLGAAYRRGDDGLTLALDACLFATRSRHLIQLQQLGYRAGYVNIARTRTLGAELGASLRWQRRVRLSLQGTYLRAEDATRLSGRGGRRLPHQPALRAYLRPELEEMPLGRHLVAGAYADVDVVGPRFADPANLVAQPGRRVFGAGASLSHPGAGLRAIFSAYNLTGAAGHDVLEYPLPGRSFFVTLELAYSIKEPHP